MARVTSIGPAPADGCNHQEFQACVVRAAHALGWNHLSIIRATATNRNGGKSWRTTTSRKGWPDLLLWHSRWGFAAIELKIGKDKARDDQLAVLAELAAAGAVTAVVYPADWQAIILMLCGRGAPVRV